MSALHIHQALSGDAAAIRAVHLAAFPGADEADLVEMLIAEGDGAVSFVAERGDMIVGHILLSRMAVSADGVAVSALGLAPVGVLPAHQRHGVGSALIEAAIGAAKEEREQMLFVLGEPEYYARFGFSAACAAPFTSPYAGPYLQALCLDESLSRVSHGRAEYAPCFARLGQAA